MRPIAPLFLFLACAALAEPMRLRCDYLENPLGIDSTAPRFSWISHSQERNWQQSAYQIAVRSGQVEIWDSGKQASAESNGNVYRGPKLQSRHRYSWTVRVWDGQGRVSQWAKPAWWEMGLLTTSDWTAKWITASEPSLPLIHWISGTEFRLQLQIMQKPRGATLFLMARGRYRARVNGREVASKKDWQEFDRQPVDLRTGANLVEVTCDKQCTLAALLQITHSDGTLESRASGSRWEADGKPAAELADKVDLSSLPMPASLLRRAFTMVKPVRSARVYATALGSYQLFLNGNRVGQDVLTPDFTDYQKRVLYQTYDVTSMLANGGNAIAAILGDGWFASGFGWTGKRFAFAPPPLRLWAQLEVEYADGTRDMIGTDESWKTAPSPILQSEIYAGETYDARLEQLDWNRAAFDDAKWNAAQAAAPPPITPSSQMAAPVRITNTLEPKSVKPRPNGSFVFDMGQNMVGWVRLKVAGPAGAQVRLRFAERLSDDGGVYTDNLRNANATDFYILKGGGPETYEPHFTFHGFRYVEVTGYPGAPPLNAITGRVTSSVANFTGKLSTSSELINHMWQIAIWGQRGNFLSIPTDCPQRDERLGWMGDAEVFWRTASYNADIAAFSHKFMHDVVDAQSSEGGFSDVSPRVVDMRDGAPGWGDAGIIVPYTTWLQYGDRAILEENWDAMERWMAYILKANPDHLRKNRLNNNFGDWLPVNSETPKDLIATAYWAYCAQLMTQMAHALGKEGDSQRYTQLFDNIRGAFQKAYISNGAVLSGTQTAYVLALSMKLAPRDMEQALVDNLLSDLKSRNMHLSTGFLGTPFLLSALVDHGKADVAYRLLFNETYPSWGYMLSKGATTWWERWNGDTGDPSMNSYNHYAFGSVVAFIYRYVAGIDATPSSPGFHEIVIHPILNERLKHARGEYDSIYGKIVSDWNYEPAATFSLKVVIPSNTSAKIYLPDVPMTRYTEGGKPIAATREGDYSVVQVGSGTYEFRAR